MSTERRRSPLPLFSLLLSATALAVAVVAIATDEGSSRPAVVVTDVDQPLQSNPDQPGVADTPAGDCTRRRVIVRC